MSRMGSPEDTNAFARVLVKTSPLTAEDIVDLRALFEFFRVSCRPLQDGPAVYISAADAVNAFRTLGLPKAHLEQNGGVMVQAGEDGKLLVNEQEFLLIAARLWRQEEKNAIPENDIELDEHSIAAIRASRLFRQIDRQRTGIVSAEQVKHALYSWGMRKIDTPAAGDLCDKWAELYRVLDQDDGEEKTLSMDEFLAIAVPLILPTIPKRKIGFGTAVEDS